MPTGMTKRVSDAHITCACGVHIAYTQLCRVVRAILKRDIY